MALISKIKNTADSVDYNIRDDVHTWGGRNYILQTINGYTLTTAIGTIPLSPALSALNPLDIITLSFEVKSTATHWIDFYWRDAASGGTSYADYNNFYPAFQITTTDTWTKFTCSKLAGANIANAKYLALRQSSSAHAAGTIIGTVEYRNMKIELGNKPTDWSPALEDIAYVNDTCLELLS